MCLYMPPLLTIVQASDGRAMYSDRYLNLGIENQHKFENVRHQFCRPDKWSFIQYMNTVSYWYGIWYYCLSISSPGVTVEAYHFGISLLIV